MVLEILNEGKDSKEINNTFIALILKCKKPSNPKYFRPISLCNVISKIVTKAIANKLKFILPEIIGNKQNVFAKGRIIIDNTLVVMEYFHWMKKKEKKRKYVMTLKLDISNKGLNISHLFFAYDILLFAHSSAKEADTILETLDKYQLSSRQVVNLDKS